MFSRFCNFRSTIFFLNYLDAPVKFRSFQIDYKSDIFLHCFVFYPAIESYCLAEAYVQPYIAELRVR